MLSPKVKVTSNEGIRIVEMRGEFIGGGETDDLRDALAKESQDGTERLLIDLAGATYLNSTALGVLISAHTSFAKRNAKVALCSVSDNIKNIFVITKLALVFTIYGSREEALAQMGRQS
jgi:anti-sigma B factor antagonist